MVFTAKTHTDRQWEDSAVTFQPGWAPSGSTEAMLPSQLRPAPGLLDPSTRERVCVFMCASVHPCERVCVCVCVCACAWAWGKGVSWEMNQPLSSATRPLTYRARFSGTQRSTLTLSRISLSLFCHFSLPPPPLSSEVNKELFQGDVRNRGGCCVRKRTCTCVRAMESVGHIRELRQPSRICTPS